MVAVEIVRIDLRRGERHKVTDHVAEELPLSVFIDRSHYGTIFCSPSDLKDLVIGHFLSEGVLQSISEIKSISLKDQICRVRLLKNVRVEERLKLLGLHSRVVLSGCGGGAPYQLSRKAPKVKADLAVKPETVSECVKNLNSIARTFRETGGVHVSAIHDDDGEVVAFAEDVGRHNAVDKAIGKSALKRVDFSRCWLALSGRITGDIVSKAALVGLPVIASLAAALDSGIRVANSAGVTLVGFVRGRRMNVYSFPERILS